MSMQLALAKAGAVCMACVPYSWDILVAHTAMQAPKCDSSVAFKLPLGTAFRAPGSLIRAAIAGDLMCCAAAHSTRVATTCRTVDA